LLDQSRADTDRAPDADDERRQTTTRARAVVVVVRPRAIGERLRVSTVLVLESVARIASHSSRVVVARDAADDDDEKDTDRCGDRPIACARAFE